MDNKNIYTTVDEQLALLESKGLTFENKHTASEILNTYGYYNIINGYKVPYSTVENGHRKYIPGTTFEQIFSLFTLDHNLRNSIMAAMLDLEERVKSAAADVIAESFGTDQNDYLKWNNYRDRRVTHHRFGLDGILNTLKKNLSSDKNPIKYYREKYGVVPPWILFKGTYFNTVVNFSRLFKNQQKQLFVQKLYGCSKELCSSKNVIDLLFSTLFVCLEYRNLAAHGGRIYNYSPEYNIQFQYDQSLDVLSPLLVNFPSKYGMSQLLILLDALEYKRPCEIIKDTITNELNRHLSSYPDDYRILGDAIGIIIYMQTNNCSFSLNGTEYPVNVISRSDCHDSFYLENVPDEAMSLLLQIDENSITKLKY